MALRMVALVVVIAVQGVLAQSAAQPASRIIWPAAQDGAMISPDGKLIAFVDWNFGDVAVREVATGRERRLADAASAGFPEPYFVFSPKSDALVFPYGNNRDAAPFRYELRVIDLASGVHHVLAAFPEDVALIAPLNWHADTGILFGKVAADGSTELLLMNPANKTTRILQRRPANAGVVWQALFTRDGTGALLLANDQLEWIDVRGGASRPVGLGALTLLGWTADERAVLFHAIRDDVVGNWSVGMSQGRPTGTPSLVERTAAGVRWAGGRTSEGVHYLEPAQTAGLFTATIDLAAGSLAATPRPILLAPGSIAGNPAWSRDGTRLAYTLAVANRNEHRVFIADGPGGKPRELASLDLRVMGLDWSADGKYVIVGGRATTRDASWVGRINATTGAIEKLATGVPANAVAAGVGDQVVFSRAALAGTRNVHVMHLRGPGATPRVLATYTTDDLPRSLSVSPDGQWVAILKSIPERKASALLLLPTSGGEPRTVLQIQRPDGLELNQGSVPWTPDGRGVLVLMRREGRRQLAAVRVDSGDITTLPFAPQEGGRRSLALHPDGRQLVYVDGPGRDELKVMIATRRDPPFN